MADSEINRLRREAIKLRRAVGNKISRVKRNTGAEIAGTNIDPRTDLDFVKNASRSELKANITMMKGFLSRSVQFVAGSGNAPLPRDRAQYFQELQSLHNKISNEHSAKLGAYLAPASPDTPIEDRQTVAQIASMHQTADGGGHGLGPWKTDSKHISGVTSADALEKLIAEKMKQVSPNYLAEKLKLGRDNSIKAAVELGELGLIEGIAELTDEQFDLLWHGTAFAEHLFTKYKSQKQRDDANRKESIEDRVIDEQFELLGELLQYAKDSVPARSKETGTKTQSNRKNRR